MRKLRCIYQPKRPLGFVKASFMLLTCAVGMGVLSERESAIAQVVPTQENGESVTGTNVVQSVEDGTTEFRITGGTSSNNGSGNNIFHEFDSFTINADEVANFIVEGSRGQLKQIDNIFGYITGGNYSLIDGGLSVTPIISRGNSGVDGIAPNLYLINPSGILFGENIQLQLPGSLTATTANVIEFGNGTLDLTSGSQGAHEFNSLRGDPTELSFIDSEDVIRVEDLNDLFDDKYDLFDDDEVQPSIVYNEALVDGDAVSVNLPGQVLSFNFIYVEDKTPSTHISELITGSGEPEAQAIDIDAQGNIILIDQVSSNNTPVLSDDTDVDVVMEPEVLEPEVLEPERRPSGAGNREVVIDSSDEQFIDKTIGNEAEVVAIPTNIEDEIVEVSQPRLTIQQSETSQPTIPSRETTRVASTAGTQTAGNISSTAALENSLTDALEETSEDSPLVSANFITTTSSTEAETEVAVLLKQIESATSEEFADYLDLDEQLQTHSTVTLSDMQSTLRMIGQRSESVRPGLMYANFVSTTSGDDSSFKTAAQPSDVLEIMLITADGTPISHRHESVTREDLVRVSTAFRQAVTRQFSRPADYLPLAQQLYDWLVRPMESHLSAQDINSLGLVMDDELRLLPLAALHDGQQFLVEKYSLGLIPSFSLTQFKPGGVPKAEKVLAMGASEFADQPPLPAVEAELSFISDSLWLGDAFINERFTLENLKQQVASQQYGIMHLATHAFFDSQDIEGSYIQLWQQRLKLSELRSLSLKDSDIAMVILSACSTALGDRDSEYGFAGLALSAGSSSAMASLWPVSDEGTLGFMTQFYEQMPSAVSRSEALRTAQISMLSGDIGIDYGRVYDAEDETLATISSLEASGSWDFSHPYYWSAFTMIGDPW